MDNPPLLEVKDLSVSFTQYTNGFSRRVLRPLEAVNLRVARGKVTAILGASGSGKSLLAHAILGILPENAQMTGYIHYDGAPLDAAARTHMLGKEVSFIPQSVNYLDPLVKVGAQVRIGLKKGREHHDQEALFQRYGLEQRAGALYPFQLSGGMLRRVLFASSVRETVRLVIADEPTPGIHHDALQEVLGHLSEMAARGVAIIMITHDIMAARQVADDVVIMRDGQMIDTEKAAHFEGDGALLNHPYSRALWRALPENDFASEDL